MKTASKIEAVLKSQYPVKVQLNYRPGTSGMQVTSEESLAPRLTGSPVLTPRTKPS
jgi:hypothetical protein